MEENTKTIAYRSEQIDLIAAALSKAQNEFTVALKNKKNPFFKSNYADFTAIVESSRPALTKYGLCVVQPPVTYDEDGSMFLLTVLMHSSGQYIQSTMKINPAKQDVQELSKYITYLKRVAYSSLVGVLTGDEDDDGEGDRMQREALTQRHSLRADQIDKIKQELASVPNLIKEINSMYGSIENIPQEKFYACLDWIKKNKDAEGK
jgi:ERF superfamily